LGVVAAVVCGLWIRRELEPASRSNPASALERPPEVRPVIKPELDLVVLRVVVGVQRGKLRLEFLAPRVAVTHQDPPMPRPQPWPARGPSGPAPPEPRPLPLRSRACRCSRG